jgi:hypothetical protein
MKKTPKKLVLAKETVRNLELERITGGTETAYSWGIVGTCSGSVHPYVCENLLNPTESNGC